MNAAKLKKYGLVPVARVRIEDRNLIIDITDPKTVKLEMCIYAFLIDGKVYRIGSSKAPLEDTSKGLRTGHYKCAQPQKITGTA